MGIARMFGIFCRTETKNKKQDVVHQPLTLPLNGTLSHNDLEFNTIQRTCFRGDRRPPEEIFTTGFKPRESISYRLYEQIINMQKSYCNTAYPFDLEQLNKDSLCLKSMIVGNATQKLVDEFLLLEQELYLEWLLAVCERVKRGYVLVYKKEINFDDILNGQSPAIISPFESNSLVSTSKRFRSALLFPIDRRAHDIYTTTHSWLYVVYVESGFDVHMHGILTTLNKNQLRNEELHSRDLMYVEEIVAKEIPPEHVIAAISFTKAVKSWQGGFFYQGRYALSKTIHMNPKCTLPKHTVDSVLHFLKEEQKLNAEVLCKEGPARLTSTACCLPLPDEGYALSM